MHQDDITLSRNPFLRPQLVWLAQEIPSSPGSRGKWHGPCFSHFRKKTAGTAMKIAIPRYRGRVSPRFGFTEDVLVMELEGDKITGQETLALDGCLPHEIPRLLHQRGVHVVLTGGINAVFQEMFRALGILVIWGLIGTPQEALSAYITGVQSPAPGQCLRRRMRRARGRGRRMES